MNRADFSGKSCLHTAICYRRAEAAKALLDLSGVNVNLAVNWRDERLTPMRLAIHARSVPLAKMLLHRPKHRVR